MDTSDFDGLFPALDDLAPSEGINTPTFVEFDLKWPAVEQGFFTEGATGDTSGTMAPAAPTMTSTMTTTTPMPQWGEPDATGMASQRELATHGEKTETKTEADVASQQGKRKRRASSTSSSSRPEVRV